MSIFLSYSRRDSELVGRLYDDLQARGLQVWMDRDNIEAGTLWRTSIVNAIQNCRVFLMVISATSQQSSNVAKEVSLAESNSKPILPLKIDDSPIEPDFRYSLAGIQFIDMPLKGYENSLQEVVKAVQQFLLVNSECGVEPSQPEDSEISFPQPDPLVAHAAPASSPQSDGHADLTPHDAPAISHEILAGIEQAMTEELGPVVRLFWSQEFGLDLLSEPESILSKLQAIGVPEDAAIRLRQRLRTFSRPS